MKAHPAPQHSTPETPQGRPGANPIVALSAELLEQALKRKTDSSYIEATFVSYETEHDYFQYHPFPGQVPPFTDYCAAVDAALCSPCTRNKWLRNSILSAADYATFLQVIKEPHSPFQLSRFVLVNGRFHNYSFCSENSAQLRRKQILAARENEEPKASLEAASWDSLLHALEALSLCKANSYRYGDANYVIKGRARIEQNSIFGESRSGFGYALQLWDGDEALKTWGYTFGELEKELQAEIKRRTKPELIARLEKNALKAHPAQAAG